VFAPVGAQAAADVGCGRGGGEDRGKGKLIAARRSAQKTAQRFLPLLSIYDRIKRSPQISLNGKATLHSAWYMDNTDMCHAEDECRDIRMMRKKATGESAIQTFAFADI